MKPQAKDFLFCLVIAALIIALVKSCGHPESNVRISEVKKEVAVAKHTKDSVHEIVVFKDRERIKYVDRWRETRHDSLIPCDEKLILCDTVIYIDSTLISALKLEILVDYSIISGQDQIIREDSLTISDLRKSVKKQKRQKVLLGILAAVGLGYGIAR